MTPFALLAAPALLCFPGAWLGFAERRSSHPFAVRLALSAVLSPVVVVAQFYALRALGLDFATTVNGVVALNLAAVVLILRGWRGRAAAPGGARVAGWALLLFAAVLLCIAIPYLWEPDFRRLSWHGLMHTDIIYAVARGGVIPEEPELAGLALGYPWLGHSSWAVLAWGLDLAPTTVYLVSNAVLLAAIGVLGFQAARALGLSPPLALATPLLFALGTNLPGLLGWAIVPSNDSALWWALLGDLRTAPFLQKLVAFEIMNFGLALFAALLWCLVVLAREPKGALRAIAVVLVAGTAALYPNLYPAAVLLHGALPLALWLEPRISGRPRDRRWPGVALEVVLAAAAGWLLLQLFGVGRSGAAAEFSSVPALGKKLIAAVLGVGPFALAAWWAWRAEPAERKAPLTVLGLGGLGSLALNLGLRLPGLNEYKFCFTAGMALIPLALLWSERGWLRRERARWLLVGALPVLLALSLLAYSIRQLPPGLPAGYAVDGGSFWLGFRPGSPPAGWTRAVRELTPLETVLVVERPRFHAPAFTGRTLFAPLEVVEPHAGYNSYYRFNLVEIRGYPAELWDERQRLLETLYRSGAADSLAAAWEALRALQRPLAIQFEPGAGSAFLGWLRERGLGRDLYADAAGGTVRFIPR